MAVTTHPFMNVTLIRLKINNQAVKNARGYSNGILIILNPDPLYCTGTFSAY
jgi:hypothetical protein